MVYTGYLEFGGREVVNGGRTSAYVATSLPTLQLEGCTDCEDLNLALGHKPYTSPLVDQPAWFDADNPDTWDFYGLYPLSFEGFEDATTEATVTEFNQDGGAVSRPRRATRSMRVTGLLIGATPAAVSAGMTWLRQVLRPSACRTGTDCTGDHLCYFVACPPLCEDSPALTAVPTHHEPYRECETGVVIGALGQCTFPYERHLYQSTVVSGPTITEEFNSSCGSMVRVEFTIVSGVPSPFGTAVHVSSGPSGNLVMIPNQTCAPDADGELLLRTNLAPNPAPADPGGWTSGDPTHVTVTRDGADRRPGVPTVKATLTTPPPPVPETVATNMATNPSMETASGTVELRRNWATVPDGRTFVTTAGTNLGWLNTRWFGAGGAGTYTNVTGASDGPIPGITNYARKTWTTAPSAGGDNGFETNQWQGMVAGAVYTVSGWIRCSAAHTNVGWDAWSYDATGVVQRTSQSTFAVAAGVWRRFSIAATVPTTGATGIKFILDVDGGTPVVGETIDVTGLLVEQIGTVGSPVSRTNLHTNPTAGRNATNWTTSGGGGTWTVTRETAAGSTTNTGALPNGAASTWVKMTNTVTNTTSPVGFFTQGTSVGGGMSAVTAGLAYSFAAFHVSSVNANGTVRMEVTWLDSGGSGIGSATQSTQVANTPDAWQRLTLNNQVAPAGAVGVRVAVRQTIGAGAFPVGGYIGVSYVQIEQVAAIPGYWDGYTMGNATTEYAWTGAPFNSPSVQRPAATGVLRDYFSGSTPTSDTDLTAAWTGAAGASTSTLTGQGVAGNTTASTRPTIRSTQWAATGTYSLRTIPNSPTSSDTYASPFGDTGALRGGMVAGMTYTAAARLYLPAAQTGSTATNARRIVAYTRIGTGSYVQTGSAQAPNTAGVTDLQVTFTVPVGATEAYIRLYNGASLGNGDAFWDNLQLVEGTTIPGGTYWDGSTVSTDPQVGYAWTGAANASTSTRTVYSVLAGMGSLTNIGAYGTTTATQPVLTAGLTHVLSVYARPQVAAVFTLSVQPVNDAGAAVGPAVTSTTTVGALAWGRLWVELTTPAGATHAVVSVSAVAADPEASVPAGTWFTVGDALVEADYGSPLAYFDGSMVWADPAIDVDWTGTASRSSSTMTRIVAVVGPILDPDCPPVPAPPRPPVIDPTCIDDPATYLRYTAEVPADAVPLWSDAVPIIRVYSGPSAVRQLRLRFYDNAFEMEVGLLDPCVFCGEFIVSYLPPNSLLTIDGIAQSATIAQGAAAAQPASHLLYGTGGGPMVWPHLTCGIRYDMAVDIVPDVTDLRIDLCIAGRE